MDRVIVSPRFMKDFNLLSRKQLRLTASVRHAGPYTGFDIAEESELQFVVCAGQLSQNIGTLEALQREVLTFQGRLAKPAFDEICSALTVKLEKPPSTDGMI